MKRRQAMAATAAGLLGAVAGAAPALGAAATTPAATTPAATTPVRLDQLRLVILSHVNDPATTFVFPGDPEFTLTDAATIPEDGFYLQYVQEGEHTGTHWGAPGHFQEGGLLADDLEAHDLYLPAVKIDVRDKAARNADYAVTVDDLKQWERRHGRIPAGAAVVLWTGWDARWGTPAFPNLDAEGRIHQPGFSPAAARWLIDTGRLGRRGALGSDTFGPDVGIDETFATSTLLYDHHRISLEALANLSQLPTTGAWVLVGGPINRKGSGSPATIYGVLPPR
jgi:kynurenine formamidase